MMSELYESLNEVLLSLRLEPLRHHFFGPSFQALSICWDQSASYQ
jgi:hypothetical protein